MQIICPECKFAREVDESKIPARSQVATCPKCHTKFKFRDLPEEDFVIEEPTPEPEPVPEPKPAADPEPKEEPVLKPFTQDDPVAPKPGDKPTFPGIPKPHADDKGGLWDSLDNMTPPDTSQESETPSRPVVKPQPPVDEQPQAPDQEQQPIPGWTGEFNEDFPDPMDAGDDEDDSTDENDMQVPPPFEQLDRYGFFSGLFMTVKLILTSPRLFFAVMPVGNGVSKPLTFAILVAMIQALAQLAWGMAGLSVTLEPTAAGPVAVPYDVSAGVFELLFTPALAAITLYIFAGFYHLILNLLKGGDKGFEGTFRALAYSYAPMVVGIFPMPTVEIFAAWMFIYAVWSLILTAIGFKHIHKTSYMKVVPALLMPLLLVMIMALLALQGQLPTV